ncbi:MAG: hypothetical protein COZ34_03435 [Candidatus Pacebacteria bacterium CG_4_10_14_3_um_filter_34_15]|nr:hypothetical protein [Candidatus Pacearchaeota archaeon]NCQ65378.1 hypothetical protein [Candidatus Paceibacterota bacterium]OIO44239.1 MAG: hypothetical protein AUJ41_03600 [Candidatus Pacebacteria bacterium CG1_02_43_31]PIQ80762.1 MAG: hypothetical protein COV78_03650 [Candidatus Pacebacteria bacterium CG11_big_fil_rev_8_21_14_0_20_34_55]PIX81373.1 MAG: hypothetical protein COZ34_03435 [Candidatus Pacebacteria bacterium CG_4_10_14_3_um_filter_34_15]PJC43898.1 MAG: hypothetical protein CO0
MSKSRAEKLAEKYGFQPEVGVEGEELDAAAQSFLFRAIVDMEIRPGDYDTAVKLAKMSNPLKKEVYERNQRDKITKHDIPNDVRTFGESDQSEWSKH